MESWPQRTSRPLSAHILGRTDAIAERWLELGQDGPIYSDAAADQFDRLLEGWLRPMARLLGEALGGSAVHTAIYLDERLRLVLDGKTAEERASLIAQHIEVEIEALAELLRDVTDPSQTKRALYDLHEPLLRRPAADDVRLLMVGDCLMSDVRVTLPSALRDRTGKGLDLDHVAFRIGWRSLESDEVAERAASVPPALIALSLFTYEAIPAYRALKDDARKLHGKRLRERVEETVEILRATVDAIREVTDAPLLVHSVSGMPLNPLLMRYRFIPAEPRPSRRRLLREINEQIVALVKATENAILLDEPALIREAGGLRAVAAPLLGSDYAGAWFHPSRFGPVLGDAYADVLASISLLRGAKVLLVDLDNTLWQGVMADGDVVHNRPAQALLKQLREAGVLLVAVSKNDSASIRWEELALQLDDFVLAKIDWRPKPVSVVEAVAELDLAPDAFLLLDDSPVERALVEENVPGVRALDPGDPFTWRTLERWLQVPSTKQTAEARKRTEMYRQAASRSQVLRTEQSYEQMMESLRLRAEVRLATEFDLDRLVELIQRTNQFNTTTRRRSVVEVRKLLASSDHEVVVASLSDRFGDLGVVAVAIVDFTVPDLADIDSFIMSCRAMGFGLEQLVLHELTANQPGKVWTGSYLPTARNGPASSLFDTAGFGGLESKSKWVLRVDAPRPGRPPWFGVERAHGPAVLLSAGSPSDS